MRHPVSHSEHLLPASIIYYILSACTWNKCIRKARMRSCCLSERANTHRPVGVSWLKGFFHSLAHSGSGYTSRSSGIIANQRGWKLKQRWKTQESVYRLVKHWCLLQYKTNSSINIGCDSLTQHPGSYATKIGSTQRAKNPPTRQQKFCISTRRQRYCSFRTVVHIIFRSRSFSW